MNLMPALQAALIDVLYETWDEALELREAHRAAPVVVEAARIVRDHFSGKDGLGMLRLRESPYSRPDLQLDDFLAALHEFLPS